MAKAEKMPKVYEVWKKLQAEIEKLYKEDACVSLTFSGYVEILTATIGPYEIELWDSESDGELALAGLLTTLRNLPLILERLKK